ncbi:MAG: hypothetical protein AAB393_19785 [Bacteroidota bacterium]
MTEAMNSEQALFTDERLVDCLQRTNGSSLKEMLETTQGRLITMLTLRYVGRE